MEQALRVTMWLCAFGFSWAVVATTALRDARRELRSEERTVRSLANEIVRITGCVNMVYGPERVEYEGKTGESKRVV